MDRNGDGIISRIELIQACRNDPRVRTLLGLPQAIRQEDGTRDTFEQAFQLLEEDASNGITLEGFLRMGAHFVRVGGPAGKSSVPATTTAPLAPHAPKAAVAAAAAAAAAATAQPREPMMPVLCSDGFERHAPPGAPDTLGQQLLRTSMATVRFDDEEATERPESLLPVARALERLRQETSVAMGRLDSSQEGAKRLDAPHHHTPRAGQAPVGAATELPAGRAHSRLHDYELRSRTAVAQRATADFYFTERATAADGGGSGSSGSGRGSLLATERRYSIEDARAWVSDRLRQRSLSTESQSRAAIDALTASLITSQVTGDAWEGLSPPTRARMAASAAATSLGTPFRQSRTAGVRARAAAARHHRSQMVARAQRAQTTAFKAAVGETAWLQPTHRRAAEYASRQREMDAHEVLAERAEELAERQGRLVGWEARREEYEGRWHAFAAFEGAVRLAGGDHVDSDLGASLAKEAVCSGDYWRPASTRPWPDSGKQSQRVAGRDATHRPQPSPVRHSRDAACPMPAAGTASETPPTWLPGDLTPRTATPTRAGFGSPGLRTFAAPVHGAPPTARRTLQAEAHARQLRPASCGQTGCHTWAGDAPQRGCALCERRHPVHLLPHLVSHAAIRCQREGWAIPLGERESAAWADGALRRVCSVCFDLIRSGRRDDNLQAARHVGDGWVRGLARLATSSSSMRSPAPDWPDGDAAAAALQHAAAAFGLAKAAPSYSSG